MEEHDRNKLLAITGILDIFLILIIFLYKLNMFDTFWVSIVLLSHVFFYYNIINYNRKILEILHYLIFILPTLSLLSDNIFIKTISLCLIVLIQILWIKENRCILNESDSKFGYADELNYYVIFLTCLLSLNIGYKIK